MDALKPESPCTEEDFYNMPGDAHAELIDGELFAMAPPSRIHQGISRALVVSIDNYIKSKNGNCRVYSAPFAVKLSEDAENIVEPDISVICDENKLTDRGCTGAPDLIIEIASPSNYRHDYVRKLKLYDDAGVREYWIVNPLEKNTVVYFLEKDNFRMTTYRFTDVIPVSIYEDFSIDFAKIISGEL